jgi:hypothetical protein
VRERERERARERKREVTKRPGIYKCEMCVCSRLAVCCFLMCACSRVVFESVRPLVCVAVFFIDERKFGGSGCWFIPVL